MNFLFFMHTLGYFLRLLLYSCEHVTRLVVKSFTGIIIAYLLDGVTDDSLVVKNRFTRDFTKDDDHASFCCSLCARVCVCVCVCVCVQPYVIVKTTYSTSTKQAFTTMGWMLECTVALKGHPQRGVQNEGCFTIVA